MVKKYSSTLICLLSSFLITAVPEKKFVILVTSYNNADWCVKNLEMIFAQTNPDNTGLYQNYRVIVIDDASDDGNAEYIEHYISACNQQHRVTLIKNKTRKRALANIYMALQLCEPDEIVFNHDGDDWIADDRVFALINSIYQNQDVWITYGSFINWPTNQMGYCKPLADGMVENKLFRKKWWMPGQLRTFYAWLFHQVQLKDLLFEGPYFQGQFFPANSDLAIYYPMMEMAGFHYQFIPEVIYIRNVETPINDFKANKDVQVLGSKLIRENKELYPTINAPRIDYFDQFKNRKANLIIFSQNNPDMAQKLITSARRLLLNIENVYVLYIASSRLQQEDYNLTFIADDMHSALQENPQAMFHSEFNLMAIECDRSNFKENLLNVLQKSTQEHILFAHDGMIFNRCTNCADCIFALERAFAYGFFLGLGTTSSISMQTGMGQPIPALNFIRDDMYAWAFHYAQSGDWRRYNNLTLTLYRKTKIVEQMQDLTFANYEELLEQWSKIPINLEQVGLCYEQPKMGYIH